MRPETARTAMRHEHRMVRAVRSRRPSSQHALAGSPSVESAWQFSKQEMIGRMITDFNDPAEAQTIVNAFSEARNSKDSKPETCMLTKPGAIVLQGSGPT